jgi:uncharacterized protein (TIGR01244 family)
LRQLDETTFVAGQIAPDDMPALAARGIRLVINNRPDGEEAGQPTAEAISAAATGAGIAYAYVPVAQLTGEAIEEMEAALRKADGPVLAFCRSGTRSTYLWALARNRMGEEADGLAGKAAAAGYDLGPIMRFMR